MLPDKGKEERKMYGGGTERRFVLVLAQNPDDKNDFI